MGKGLSQITFDFATPEEEEITPVVPQTALKEEKVEIKEEVPEATVIENTSSTGKRGRKSLKEIALNADLLQIPEDDILFKKQYYAIGEVAGMFRENQSLIRYWETEFDILKPRKNRKGDRFFSSG